MVKRLDAGNHRPMGQAFSPRAVVNDHRKPSGVPWVLWVGLLLVGFVILTVYRLYPPSFEHSSPRLEMRGEVLAVGFQAVNRSRTPVTKTLLVSIGTLHFGPKGSGPHYWPLDHREIVVTLAPSETRHVHCGFPNPGTLHPTVAEISVLR